MDKNHLNPTFINKIGVPPLTPSVSIRLSVTKSVYYNFATLDTAFVSPAGRSNDTA